MSEAVQAIDRRVASSVNHMFEIVRFACAAAIVVCHIDTSNADYLAFALSLFLILTTTFSVQAAQTRDLGRFMRSRARRILVPWLAWSAFYTVIAIALTRDWRGPLLPDSPWSFLIGSTIHLWFLPFVFVVSALVAVVAPRIRSGRQLAWLTAWFIPLAIGCFYLHQLSILPDPFGQWAYSLPAVLFGIVVVLSARYEAKLLPIVFVAVVTVCAVALGGPLHAAPHLAIAAILYLLCARMRVPGHPVVTELGRLAFGVYLIHPFMMLVFFKLFGTGHSVLSASITIVLMSTLAALAMSRLAQLPLVRRRQSRLS